MSQGQPAADAALAADSKLVEFNAFDRKVSVLQRDENVQPSLYSLVRSWVRNGRPGPSEGPEDTAKPSISLPPSQTLPAEPLDYPPECFSKFYLGDDPSGELKNLANVYKSAWVTAHTHYSHHKIRRRRRHAQRHNALLAVAQQTQKARLSSGAAPLVPIVPSEPLHPAPAPHSPTMKPASIAPAAATASQGHSTAPAGSKQAILDPPTWHGAPTRPHGPQANTPQPLSARGKVTGPAHPHNPSSSGAFGTGAFNGVDSLRGAHNLADRSATVGGASQHAMHAEAPGSSSQMATGPVNLADMQLRTVHQGTHQQSHSHQQLAASVALDAGGVHAPQKAGVGAGAPAFNMHGMHAKHSGVNVGSVSSVGGYGAGVARGSVSWEGRHSEQETEDLQRQLQQLAEKESPVPIALQPPMPIDASAQQGLHSLPRRAPDGGHERDGGMRAAPGESQGKPPPGMVAMHGQPAILPGGDQHTGTAPRVSGPMGGTNGMQVRGVAARQNGGQGGVQQGQRVRGEMLMDGGCGPASNGSNLLDMKDAFALDEVMDISPVV